ncbi:protein FRIGIDA-like [Nicotiana tabacum]|uniref:FRIGIDA-like protein n=2 Tax=Nicotiana TaxID=4085 RepID=A0A1S4DAD4_TOBAC|nr:PREDICTED: protein FRIGIDA-like [Nicotiana sylvestris]
MNTRADAATATAGSATPSLATQLVKAEQKQSELQQSSTHFTHSVPIANLRKLSDALSGFQRCFGELQRHIDTIRTSIDSSLLLLLPRNNEHSTTTTPPAPPFLEPEPYELSEEEEEEEEKEKLKSPPRAEPKSFRLELKFPPPSVVEILCETMNSNGLQKYMIRHLSNIKTLKRRVPKALKLSPNPARLILECIGDFYSQGSDTYVQGSSERQVKVLLLECFLNMMGESVIKNEVKEEAEQAALTWIKRLNFKGGILQAQEIECRGLLLLIGCFGIPQAFTNKDIKDLLHQSYIKMISASLRRSGFLMAKIPEIIEGMLKQNRVVEAVHFVYCFGLEERFNPRRLLTSFLQESEVSLLDTIKSYEEMKGSQDSVVVAKSIGVRRYVAGLRSVIQCLGRHNIDHSKFLPGWQFGMKITRLEREIAQLRKRMKIDREVARKRKIDEAKWLGNKEVKHSHFPNPCLPQHRRVANHVDDSNNTLLEGGGTADHIYGHSLYPPVLHGPVTGSIHENVVGSLAGPGAGISASADGIHAGISAGTDVVMQGVSYAGGHEGSQVNCTTGQMGSHAGQLYGSRGDAAVYDRLPSHSYAYRPSSYLECSGSMGLPNTILGDAYRPPPYLECSMGLPSTITGDVFRPRPYQHHT